MRARTLALTLFLLALIGILIGVQAQNVTVTGSTTSLAPVAETDDFEIDDDLDVDDDVWVGGDITVVGTASLATVTASTLVSAEDVTADDDVTAGDDLISTDDVTVGDDLTVTDDASLNQITSGETIPIHFVFASPASPESLSHYAPADGTLRLIVNDMEGGTCTAVLRNNTDGVNLATRSCSTTMGYTATITSAEDVDAGDELKVTITADSSGVGLNLTAYLVTSSAVSPEG